MYQQLRSHLVYLNLSALGDALPNHLEQARHDNIGHTRSLKVYFK